MSLCTCKSSESQGLGGPVADSQAGRDSQAASQAWPPSQRGTARLTARQEGGNLGCPASEIIFVSLFTCKSSEACHILLQAAPRDGASTPAWVTREKSHSAGHAVDGTPVISIQQRCCTYKCGFLNVPQHQLSRYFHQYYSMK